MVNQNQGGSRTETTDALRDRDIDILDIPAFLRRQDD